MTTLQQEIARYNESNVGGWDTAVTAIANTAGIIAGKAGAGKDRDAAQKLAMIDLAKTKLNGSATPAPAPAPPAEPEKPKKDNSQTTLIIVGVLILVVIAFAFRMSMNKK
jgi:hypothetical protein